jgi:phosphoenolpyruvate carboxykinase (GTP)
MRVLKWVLDRVANKVEGEEHIFGVTPAYEHLHLDGLDLSKADYQQITSIDIQAWKEELSLHAELFEKLAHRLPSQLDQTRRRLLQILSA